MQLNFNSISEAKPGVKWQKLFNTHWHAYKAWFQSKGAMHSPDLKTSVANLEKYMPEFVPTYKKLCELAGDDKGAARFLTGYQPPAYISGCSQLVWEEQPLLVRNYDYHPNLSEGTLLHSAWNGKQVIGIGDCLSGIVDGMNDDGLVASLTFGGRKAVGKGFGIPFILRYVLEFCSNVDEAVEVLKRVPSHMAYNVMVLDKTRKYKMVQIAPDHAPIVKDVAVSTNHQGAIDWPEHAQFSKTLEREKFLHEKLKESGQNSEKIIETFLNSPLFNRQYNDGFGTIYTSVYKPAEGGMELRWPDKKLVQSFDNFTEGITAISYSEKAVPASTYIPPAYEPAATPAYQPSQDANYWIEYGKSWATGAPTQLATQVAKTIVDALGIGGSAQTDKILEEFVSENKKRGQVPWEMLADLWSNIGGFYGKKENE